jgi:hypothetical protein
MDTQSNDTASPDEQAAEAAIFDPSSDFPFPPSASGPRHPWTTICGALFGLLDFQRRISTRPGRSLAEIYLRQFSRHPVFVLPQLLELHTHHAPKLRKRYAMAQLDTLIMQVAGQISVADLPSMTTPSQATEIHVAYMATRSFLQESYDRYMVARYGVREVAPADEIKPYDDEAPDDEAAE